MFVYKPYTCILICETEDLNINNNNNNNNKLNEKIKDKILRTCEKYYDMTELFTRKTIIYN